MKLPIVILAGLVALYTPAYAQSNCIEYGPLRDFLFERGDRIEGTGEVQFGAAQLWVAPNGEWALFGISPEGVACIILAGENWTTPERL
jgi:hypothetical protein